MNPALPGMPEMRAAFEAWAKDHLGRGYSLDCDEGVYINPVTRWACKAFAAGRAEASKDAERLDWLIEHETHVREVNAAFTLFGVGRFSSGREAIDAAMQKFPAQGADHADQA